MDLTNRIVGCLLGGAVGDALGLPYEGQSRRHIAAASAPPRSSTRSSAAAA
jgi:ADP-ribosylglycohydrolase